MHPPCVRATFRALVWAGVVQQPARSMLRAGCTLPKGADGDPELFLEKLTGFGHNDMCSMIELTQERILANLQLRFKGEIVYTYVGDIIVSVNPFKNTGAVGKAIRSHYKSGPARASLPPHIYMLVHGSYHRMRSSQVSQSILISGESGAGKTEAMKICLTFIGELSARHGDTSDDVANKLAQTNPVMEVRASAT